MRRAPYVAALAALALYLALSAAGAGPGMPLDDGWIHLTYARNLARHGQLAFVPGAPSAGSTSPLWSVALAVGYLLGAPGLWWAFALGAAAFVALIWAVMRLWRLLWPAYARRDWTAGLALALSWPLVWAAGSGMETLLFIALGFVLLADYMQERAGAARLGLLAGLLVLARPEGVILAALIAAAMALQAQWRRLAIFGAAGVAPLLPYFWFNLALSGELWPNTFYAKQTEYAALLARPLPQRFLQLLYYSLGGAAEGWRGISGAHLALAPGLTLAGWRSLRDDAAQRRLWRTLPLLWAGGHILAYALRLPVTYQHGRYLWAAIPVWTLLGLGGWAGILGAMQRRRPPGRIMARTLAAVFAALLLFFLLLGAVSYAEDVAFVQHEMVDVALWLRDHTPPEALVAAHDIGALGYFAGRPLLDLAGLVTPEVIPLLHDEAQLARYVQAQGADYLVTAPGWPYEALIASADAVLLYDTGYAWTRQHGFNNMAVYGLQGAAR